MITTFVLSLVPTRRPWAAPVAVASPVRRPPAAPRKRRRAAAPPPPQPFRRRGSQAPAPALPDPARTSRGSSRPGGAAPERGSSSWEARAAELDAFVQLHGHAGVPRDDPRHAALYRWTLFQRYEWNRGRLSDARYRRLSALPGFVWDKHYETWKANFFRLVSFQEQHGHCSVALSESSPEHAHLARWVVKQRYLAKHGLLNDDRRRRLEGVGFQFRPEEDRFQARLGQLRQFADTHGHVNVPRSWPEDPAFARWVDLVRALWIRGKLSARHHRALTDLGFSFSPAEDTWDMTFLALQWFARSRGHCYPSFFEDRHLHRWLVAQKKCYLAGTLTDDRRTRLAQLGVDFRPWKLVFTDALSELSGFYKTHGHIRVPASSKLGTWLAYIRARGRRGLSALNITELDSLPFKWE